MQEIKKFYVDHLKNHLLPFWFTHGIDSEYGGYHTCFENVGTKRTSTDKYAWSQGRMVYMLGKLCRMDIFTPDEQKTLLSLAKSGADFLMRHVLMENGHCAFLMERDGTHKLSGDGIPMDASIYADCFVILGMSSYAIAAGDEAAYRFAETLYRGVVERIASGEFLTAPYPAPKGFRHHGIPMIMLNTSREFYLAARCFDEAAYKEAFENATGYLMDILDTFVDENGYIREMKPVSLDGGKTKHDDVRLIGRYINPGHVIEDMWFVIEHAEELGRDDIVRQACDIAYKTFQLGWDKEYGGVQLFCDLEGGAPKGDVSDTSDEPMVKKVTADWGSKLWWVHSETLYTSLLCYKLTGEARFMEMYKQAAEYTFRIFPEKDTAIGEWIQIHDRTGEPESRVVALPVKDPFHIVRNVLKIIELY